VDAANIGQRFQEFQAVHQGHINVGKNQVEGEALDRRRTSSKPATAGHTSEEGVLRAMEAGARAYIRKPLTVKDLSEKIAPLLADKLETAKT
jgi:DNA-binding response OmpR family regulator